jgi:ligand-binding SRPBCC domain-containing protein
MHQLKTIQKLPISLDEAWAFFSSPKNLAVITPEELNLVPTSELPEAMYPGIFVEYSVKPLLGIPVKWVTEITHIRERSYFIDEQRLGPYRIWHHQHHFKEIEGGVEMLDIVDYRLPLGLLGIFMHEVLVKNKVKGIFEFRRQRLEALFGKWQVPQTVA